VEGPAHGGQGLARFLLKGGRSRHADSVRGVAQQTPSIWRG